MRAEPCTRRAADGSKRQAALSSIWLTNLRSRRSTRLTPGPHHTQPRWAPDGTVLAFVAVRPSDGVSQVQTVAYSDLLQSADGESASALLPTRPLLKLARNQRIVTDSGLPAMQWAPDSRRIGLLVRHSPFPGSVSQVYDVNEEMVRLHCIEMVRESGDDPELTMSNFHCISPADMQVWEFAWSPTSMDVAAVVSDDPYEHSWLTSYLARFSAPRRTKDTDPVTPPKTQILWKWATSQQICMPTWSPSGAWVAFISSVMSDRLTVGGDVWVVRAAIGVMDDDSDTEEASLAAASLRSSISAQGQQSWNVTDGIEASFSWLVWAEENEMLALAQQDAGAALYELDSVSNNSAGSHYCLWSSSECAAAEASWPRFCHARRAGTLAAIFEGPEAPREIWAAEHHREHRTIVKAELTGGGSHRLVSAQDSPTKREFVLFEVRCHGLLQDWSVSRRFSDFVNLR
eukprot:COSAG01_NODE_13761_length_1538_cov_241.157748_1_plen_458_part_01